MSTSQLAVACLALSPVILLVVGTAARVAMSFVIERRNVDAA